VVVFIKGEVIMFNKSGKVARAEIHAINKRMLVNMAQTWARKLVLTTGDLTYRFAKFV
jgi:hypothetical protein